MNGTARKTTPGTRAATVTGIHTRRAGPALAVADRRSPPSGWADTAPAPSLAVAARWSPSCA
jgi:hypothetical protein